MPPRRRRLAQARPVRSLGRGAELLQGGLGAATRPSASRRRGAAFDKLVAAAAGARHGASGPGQGRLPGAATTPRRPAGPARARASAGAAVEALVAARRCPLPAAISYNEAQKAYNEALKLDPTNETARRMLERVERKLR